MTNNLNSEFILEMKVKSMKVFGKTDFKKDLESTQKKMEVIN